MLRKRSRSHRKDQHMGRLMSDVSESYINSDALGQKHKSNSFFNAPGVFVGFSPKGSESDSVRSPTSPLDFRVFSNLGSPFRFTKSSLEKHQKSWDCSKVGLSIIDSLDDETKHSGKVLRSVDSTLFGQQMRIKAPKLGSRFDSFETPQSLPKDYAIFPYTQIKPSNSQMGNSDVIFGIGEAPLEPESFGKIQSCSLDSKSSGSHLTSLTSPMTSLSSGNFCLKNGTNPVSLPCHFIRGDPILSNSLATKLPSIPLPIGSVDGFIGSLSASEIELSEDYTCVRIHGPNPKTTHIFGDCILECHNNEFTDFFKNEEQEIALSPAVKYSTSYPSNDFLSFCYSCKKNLEGEDIYIYRGEKAFCSWSCRSQEILIDEEMEKTNNDSSTNCLQSKSWEELFETSMFIAT